MDVGSMGEVADGVSDGLKTSVPVSRTIRNNGQGMRRTGWKVLLEDCSEVYLEMVVGVNLVW